MATGGHRARTGSHNHVREPRTGRPLPRAKTTSRTPQSHILGRGTSGTEGLVESWSGLRSLARRSAKRQRPPWSSWVWPRLMPKSWCYPNPRWACSVVRAARPGFGPGVVRAVPVQSDQVGSGTRADVKGLVGARMVRGRGRHGIGRHRRMVETVGARAPAETPREATKGTRGKPAQSLVEVGTATGAVRREERGYPARKARVGRTPRPPSEFVCQRRRKTTWLRA